jgi:hypothetical protein
LLVIVVPNGDGRERAPVIKFQNTSTGETLLEMYLSYLLQ